MLESIFSDLAAHKFTAALLTTLLVLSSLAASGKIDPFLARFSQFQKTVVLAVLAASGVFAQAAESGVGLPVAFGRAVPPLLLLVLAHFAGNQADPAATAQKAADVALGKQTSEAAAVVAQARAPKVPPLALLLLCIRFSIVLLVGASFFGAPLVFLEGCTKAQGAAGWSILKDASGAICQVVVQAENPALAPLCTSLVEIEAAMPLFPSSAVGSKTVASQALYEAILAYRAKELEAARLRESGVSP